MKDQALIEAIGAIRDLAPDVKNTIASIATLNEKVANIEGNTAKAFDMLLALQHDEQSMRRMRWKSSLALLGALITMIGNVLLSYFHK